MLGQAAAFHRGWCCTQCWMNHLLYQKICALTDMDIFGRPRSIVAVDSLTPGQFLINLSLSSYCLLRRGRDCACTVRPAA